MNDCKKVVRTSLNNARVHFVASLLTEEKQFHSFFFSIIFEGHSSSKSLTVSKNIFKLFEINRRIIYCRLFSPEKSKLVKKSPKI
jgi:hypothetical protein